MDKRLLALILLLIGVIIGVNIWMAIEGWDFDDDDDDYVRQQEKLRRNISNENINFNVDIDIDEEAKKAAINSNDAKVIEKEKSEEEFPVMPKFYPSSIKVLSDDERIKMEREMNPVPPSFHHFVEDQRRTDDSLDTMSMFPTRTMFDPHAEKPEMFIEGIEDEEEEADRMASQSFNIMSDVILEKILQEHHQLKHAEPQYEDRPSSLNSQAAASGLVDVDQMMEAADKEMDIMRELRNESSALLGEIGKLMAGESESDFTTAPPQFDPFGKNEFSPFWNDRLLKVQQQDEAEPTENPESASANPMGDSQPFKPFMFLSEPKVLGPSRNPFIQHLLRSFRVASNEERPGFEVSTMDPSDVDILRSGDSPFFRSQNQEDQTAYGNIPPSFGFLSNLQTRPVAAESMSGFYGQDPYFAGEPEDQRFQYETVIEDDKNEGPEYQESNPSEQIQYLPLSSLNLPQFETRNETAAEETREDEEVAPGSAKRLHRSESVPMYKQIYPSLIESRNEK